jgi:hypothetical protein
LEVIEKGAGNVPTGLPQDKTNLQESLGKNDTQGLVLLARGLKGEFGDLDMISLQSGITDSSPASTLTP